MSERIFHIVTRDTWAAAEASGVHRPASVDAEGFVHFSFAHQVRKVHAARYTDVPDLVVVEIDPDQVDAELRVEDSYGAGEEFPHIYGGIPTSARVATYTLDDPMFSVDGPSTTGH